MRVTLLSRTSALADLECEAAAAELCAELPRGGGGGGLEAVPYERYASERYARFVWERPALAGGAEAGEAGEAGGEAANGGGGAAEAAAGDGGAPRAAKRPRLAAGGGGGGGAAPMEVERQQSQRCSIM
jgi:hypothetical protein